MEKKFLQKKLQHTEFDGIIYYGRNGEKQINLIDLLKDYKKQLKLNGVGKRTCNNCLYCIINNKSEFNYDKYICTEGYHKNTISDIHNYGCNKFENL